MTTSTTQKPDTTFFEKLIPSQDVQKLTPEEMKVFRSELRDACTATKIVFNDFRMTPTGSFDGAGDSGNSFVHTSNDHVDAFLEWMLSKHVNFDWYNNDGGGGDIVWDIHNDKVTINGYQNITETKQVMDEEVF